MNVLIVEDEELLAIELADRLLHLDNEIRIAGQTNSVLSTVEWLRNNTCDLIFMDIHLNDGSSFSIFDKIKVDTPVIFTTAYDQYAIRAFEVNSIGYLLKPINEIDLKKALDKYKEIRTNSKTDIANLLEFMTKGQEESKKYLSRIIVTSSKIQIPLNVSDIAYFMAEGRYLFAITKNGNKYFCESTLYKLEDELDKNEFFRLSRSFIVSFDSVVSFTPFSKSRVKVRLVPQAEEEIIISSEKIKEFKEWLAR